MACVVIYGLTIALTWQFFLLLWPHIDCISSSASSKNLRLLLSFLVGLDTSTSLPSPLSDEEKKLFSSSLRKGPAREHGDLANGDPIYDVAALLTLELYSWKPQVVSSRSNLLEGFRYLLSKESDFSILLDLKSVICSIIGSSSTLSIYNS